MLQRLIDTAGLPETNSDMIGRLVLALGVASLTLAVAATIL